MGVQRLEVYFHGEASSQQRPIQHLSQLGRIRVQQNRKCAEVCKVDGSPLRQPKRFRCQRKNRLAEQRLELKFSQPFDRRRNTEVDLPPFDAFEQVMGCEFPQLDVDAGIGLSERKQRLRQYGGCNGRHAADGERPALDVDHVTDLAQSIFPLVQRPPGMGEKLLAFACQFNPPRRAVKDGDADLLLELLDLNADSGLRTAELSGRQAEAAVLGDGNEHMKKLEVYLRHERLHSFENQINS